ncbi:cytochrome b/b6 domain-containing protein [Aquitalea aquatica]|uniref:Cytochrome b/b6 domain-containing protein n=1 Tax=Aquitalea aquatica TaxID=3044273 RepID=A0A838YFC0_9NEIS|nr:cytochrome b/b6 domain-containing protein [Aquitalea magnusonii]MBA4709444.1 cytochrome b/b6 domain-containing protein [Aquitalea magnusonii]
MVQMIKVWDAPTRFFHWTLVALFAGMWFSGEQGGDWLRYHVLCGEAVAALLLFRLIWGVVGSETARFSQFIKGPAAIRRYLKGEGDGKQLGHNPLGGLMVVALLTVLLLQVASGLFASDVDSYTFDGPLAKLIASGLSESITGFHKLLFNFILLLVAMHVAAIVAYRVLKKQNLVKPMLTGYQQVAGDVSPLRFRSGLVAVLALLAAGGGVFLLTRL